MPYRVPTPAFSVAPSTPPGQASASKTASKQTPTKPVAETVTDTHSATPKHASTPYSRPSRNTTIQQQTHNITGPQSTPPEKPTQAPQYNTQTCPIQITTTPKQQTQQQHNTHDPFQDPETAEILNNVRKDIMGPAVPGASYTLTLHSPLRASFIPGALVLSLGSEDNTPPLTPIKPLEQPYHTPTKETEDCLSNNTQHPTPPASTSQHDTAQHHTQQQYTNQQLEAPVPNRLYPIFKELYVAQNKVAQLRHHTNIANLALETQTFFINPNIKLQAVNPNDQLHKEFKELTTHYQNKVTELLRDHYMEQYHIFAQNVTNIQSRINALSDPEGPRAIAKAQSIAHKKYTHPKVQHHHRTPRDHNQPKTNHQAQTLNKRAPLLPTPNTAPNNKLINDHTMQPQLPQNHTLRHRHQHTNLP